MIQSNILVQNKAKFERFEWEVKIVLNAQSIKFVHNLAEVKSFVIRCIRHKYHAFEHLKQFLPLIQIFRI